MLRPAPLSDSAFETLLLVSLNDTGLHLNELPPSAAHKLNDWMLAIMRGPEVTIIYRIPNVVLFTTHNLSLSLSFARRSRDKPPEQAGTLVQACF